MGVQKPPVPALTSLRRVLDETVLSKLCGKHKKMSDPRPGFRRILRNNEVATAILGEFEETSDHEEDQKRLELPGKDRPLLRPP